MQHRCPICEEGWLYEFTTTTEVKETIVSYELSVCNVCGIEIATPEQMKRNADKLRELITR
jgi:uncharacterized protein (DUF983 family)